MNDHIRASKSMARRKRNAYINDKVKCIRVSIEGDGSGFTELMENANKIDIPALFDGAEVEDKYTLELLEMSRLEYDSLPKFTGF